MKCGAERKPIENLLTADKCEMLATSQDSLWEEISDSAVSHHILHCEVHSIKGYAGSGLITGQVTDR